MSPGQNLRSTSGEPELVAQEFFEIPASVCGHKLMEAEVGGDLFLDESVFVNTVFNIG
jgi:hypothetical protein